MCSQKSLLRTGNRARIPAPKSTRTTRMTSSRFVIAMSWFAFQGIRCCTGGGGSGIVGASAVVAVTGVAPTGLVWIPVEALVVFVTSFAEDITMTLNELAGSRRNNRQR